MPNSKTYVLVAVDANLSETNIKEDIADLGGAYTIVDTISADEGVVEALGQPAIKWSDSYE